MKEPIDIKVDFLEPAGTQLTPDQLFHVQLAVGAQAIRYGLPKAIVTSAPDDYPNLVATFLETNGKARHSWHFNVETSEFIRYELVKLPEPTRQPDDPIDVPCANGKSCNC